MNPTSNKPGIAPPAPAQHGTQSEEPQISQEDDIAPEDDGTSDEGKGGAEKRPLRNVERE